MPTYEHVEHVPINPDPETVKQGDILLLAYYVKVDKIKKTGGNLEFQVTDIYDNSSMVIKGGVLVSRNSSADQFHREVKISRSAILEIMKTANSQIMTVSFVKENGEERTARVRYIRPEDNFGRSYAFDLDKLDAHNKPSMIQIDHRSLNSMIYQGVKYTCKTPTKPKAN